jgi:hypothetical protein
MTKFLSHWLTKILYKNLLMLLLYVITAALILNVFMHKNFIDNTPKNEVSVCLSYNAVKPWCYRVLVPFTVNKLKDISDELNLGGGAHRLMKYPKVADRVEKMKVRYEFQDNVDIENYFILYGLFFLILLSLLFAIRQLTKEVFVCHELVYLCAPILIMLLYPLSFVGSGNLYDFLEILFLVIALICLIRNYWVSYYIVFALAILNKESNILLGIYFIAMYFKVYSVKKLGVHTLIHAVVGLPVFFAIRILFKDNPGGQFWSHFDINIEFLTQIKSYFLFNDVYAYMIATPRGYNIWTMFLLIVSVGYSWYKKPLFARRILMISYPLLFLLCLTMGNKDEIRNFSFLFPIIYLLGLDTLLRLYSADFKLKNKKINL